MKIPVLFQHFAEHRREDPSISLFAFLQLHYKGSFAVDEDYKRDQELPFRTNETIVNNFIACEVTFPLYELLYQHPVDKKRYNTLIDDTFPVLCIRDIFQPPRQAFT